ncbi:hypothetical protein FG093_24725, partial [Vibrio parahaemolyticus]|nr:hypothetical protein [Vibrio parahaemolyticus]
MLSECRNHIPFVLSEVCVFHVFYFLAGANFMIITSHCIYVQRCRTSYLNSRSHTAHTDEFATTSENDWGDCSEGADKADIDFLVERRDVFDSSRIEFEEDEQD